MSSKLSNIINAVIGERKGEIANKVYGYEGKIKDIEKSFMEMRNGRIRISDTVHPGVKIIVGTIIKPIREPMQHVTFYADEGEVKAGSY